MFDYRGQLSNLRLLAIVRRQNIVGRGFSDVKTSAVDHGYLRDEAITSSRERLDKSRVFSGIVQSLPKSFDGGVQTVLEVHERIAWPELVFEIVSSHQFPRLVKQHGKDLNWLPLHLNLASMLAKLTRSKIEFETLEMDDARGGYWLAHSPSLSSREVVALRARWRVPSPVRPLDKHRDSITLTDAHQLRAIPPRAFSLFSTVGPMSPACHSRITLSALRRLAT